MLLPPAPRGAPRRTAPSPSSCGRWSVAALAAAVTAAAPGRPLAAQTMDDGFLMPTRELRIGVQHARDRWSEYWEGTLRRSNDNIGTLTTQATTVAAAYGVSRHLSLHAALPYVTTAASRGVLHGMQGWQDVTVAAKVRLLETGAGRRATVRGTLLGGVAAPTSDYTPDFQPLSIGLGARRATTRANLQLQDRSGLFAEVAGGYTWRSTVRLDRPAYYTDGALVLSDEVRMPDVADVAFVAGFQRGPLCIPLMLVAQRTLGGGDIRRQDMPFVSNRMDWTRLQGRVMVWLPRVPLLPAVQLDLGAARTVAGRNVGRSTTLSAGVTTAFRL